jgi:tartrate dehydrogenase/decarboxylase/D-malate dehydrogenase
MLEFLEEDRAAQSLMNAIESVTTNGVLTPDLGGKAKTIEFTDAVLAELV